MKKGKHGAVFKALSSVAVLGCTIVLVAALLLAAFLAQKNIFSPGDITQPDFEKSQYFERLWESQLDKTANYIDYSRLIETDGEYSEDKTVDIFEYARNGNLEGKNKDEAHTYLLQDLVNWGGNWGKELVSGEPVGMETSTCSVETTLALVGGRIYQVQRFTLPYEEEETIHQKEITSEEQLGQLVVEHILSALQDRGIQAGTLEEAYGLIQGQDAAIQAEMAELESTKEKMVAEVETAQSVYDAAVQETERAIGVLEEAEAAVEEAGQEEAQEKLEAAQAAVEKAQAAEQAANDDLVKKEESLYDTLDMIEEKTQELGESAWTAIAQTDDADTADDTDDADAADETETDNGTADAADDAETDNGTADETETDAGAADTAADNGDVADETDAAAAGVQTENTDDGGEVYYFDTDEGTLNFMTEEYVEEEGGMEVVSGLDNYSVLAKDVEEEGTGEDAASQVIPTIFQYLDVAIIRLYSYIDYVEEEYLPLDGVGLAARLKDGTVTMGEAQEWYENLMQALTELPAIYEQYVEMKNSLDGGDSSIGYYFSGGGVERTNLAAAQIGDASRDTLTALGRQYGSYLYYNSAKAVTETDVSGLDDYFRENFGHQTDDKLLSGKNVTFLMVFDTSAISSWSKGDVPEGTDAVYTAWKDYNTYRPMILVSIILVLAALAGWIAGMVCVTVSAGRVRGQSGVRTYWVDRVYGEIMAVLEIVLVVFACLAIDSVCDSYTMDGGETLLVVCAICAAAFLAMGGTLIFYTSLVRRIKAGTIWSQTVTAKIVQAVTKLVNAAREAYEYRAVTGKMVIMFVTHLCLCLIFVLVIFAGEMPFLGGFLLVVLCAFEMFVLLRDAMQRQKLESGIRKIADGDLKYKLDTAELNGINKGIGSAINRIGDGLDHAVEASMKNERLKTDLITNVSHDIKTPLTSIINYVDLLQREQIDNEKVQEYLNVLAAKSQRLKQLTEDLVEASKCSSGNVKLYFERIDFVELVNQTSGEFAERFEAAGLTEIRKIPQVPVVVWADGRSLFRVVENLYQNAAKYALANTRVYVDLAVGAGQACFSLKNISRQELNIRAEELTERFIRGDIARSTEGSGLGLSIARNLTELMHGKFHIYLDGDLFKVTLVFPLADGTAENAAGGGAADGAAGNAAGSNAADGASGNAAGSNAADGASGNAAGGSAIGHTVGGSAAEGGGAAEHTAGNDAAEYAAGKTASGKSGVRKYMKFHFPKPGAGKK